MVKIREHNINPQILTKCAQKGIFRWFDGFASGNYQATRPTEPFGPISLNTVEQW
jgi:hypothetical protein